MTERNAERERLIELLKNAPFGDHPFKTYAPEVCLEHIVDHLLANGVVVPPVKVGQTVYDIRRPAIKWHWHEGRWIVDEWGEWEVCKQLFSLTLWENGTISFDYFITREAAEKALERMERG